ncbi:hypothetical protein SDC9_186407 [bioreactor metagenome]|uniref:Uncharacterized protein n=1 Tax=bioreactor metagenome TaxID=1076179 RepID=A0A645HKG1_9ZZZZ
MGGGKGKLVSRQGNVRIPAVQQPGNFFIGSDHGGHIIKHRELAHNQDFTENPVPGGFIQTLQCDVMPFQLLQPPSPS